MEKVFIVADRLWFRRSFILNGSTASYANFKLTIQMDKNLATRKSFTTKLHTILINGQEATIQSSTSRDISNGREEITFMLANKGFSYGINYVLISFYLTPITPLTYPMSASTDPFTFDAQLISTSLASVPAPRSRQLKLTDVMLAAPACAGDSVSVQFAALGNETDFPILYEAQLSTPSRDIPLAEGTRSPIRAKLPDDVTLGNYKIKVATKSAFMDLTESSETVVGETAAGSFTLDKIAVNASEKLTVTLNFTGTMPIYYFMRYGPDTLRGSASGQVLERVVALNQTATFSLDSVRNVCGYGDVSGTRTVMVTFLVGVDPLSVRGITAYPNPTSEQILIKNNRIWKSSVHWRIYHAGGVIVKKGSDAPLPNAPLAIDIRDLPAGLYLLGLTEGGRENTWKIVKE